MDDPLNFCPEEFAGVKEALENNDQAAAAAKIQQYLEKQDKIPLNIGITGESGAGKSTFINAFRGVDNRDEQAAPTGTVETTMQITKYPHPNYPNVFFWDLPGIGTTNFPADEYLKRVEFEKFDFFIIISDTRFREHDVKLAQEIQKMEKKFYFVRSKIDNDVRAEERSQRDFSLERSLAKIKEYCIDGLEKGGIKSSKVFLVSSFDLHIYDFSCLHKTLEEELPAHKRNVLLFSMPSINMEIINKKKEAFQHQIKWYSVGSAALAGVSIPGIPAVDLMIMVKAVKSYIAGFGLHESSLRRLSSTTGVPYDELCAVLQSPLAAKEMEKITTDLIQKLLITAASRATSRALEMSRFIPLFGIPVTMSLSFTTTCSALSLFLNMLADDAQRVFEKALGLNTSV
ncbi:interferon-inducible GTPase 5-like [Archocentrus centrarchus]|uniref:interferon-inducible GTPase 5-like n=1 Tax=Archocentrus centrarchus TaxID=63155 RepID=UPI0011E9C405|nr:interferon-inducible GTPase 5-like [Archocentrus centrarchus]